MSPIQSVIASDFDKTAPYTPDRELTEQAADVVILQLTVEGLGGINDYSVRIEMPGFDDNLKAIAGIVHQVHAAAFAVNWEVAIDGE
jgi:hypothetical protein